MVDSANVAPWLPLPQETVDKRTLPRLPVLMLRSAHSPVKNIKDLPLSCFTWILCYGRKHWDFCQEYTGCLKKNASIAAGYWRPFIGAPCRFRFRYNSFQVNVVKWYVKKDFRSRKWLLNRKCSSVRPLRYVTSQPFRIAPIVHWAYWPISLSTIKPIEPIDHQAY